MPTLEKERLVVTKATEELQQKKEIIGYLDDLSKAVIALNKSQNDRNNILALRQAMNEYLKTSTVSEFTTRLDEIRNDIKPPEGTRENAAEISRNVLEGAKKLPATAKAKLDETVKDYQQGDVKAIAKKHPIKSAIAIGLGAMGILWLARKITGAKKSSRISRALKFFGVTGLAYLILRLYGKGSGGGFGLGAAPGSGTGTAPSAPNAPRVAPPTPTTPTVRPSTSNGPSMPKPPKPDIPEESEEDIRRRTDARLMEKPAISLKKYNERHFECIAVMGGENVQRVNGKQTFFSFNGGYHDVGSLIKELRKIQDNNRKVIEVQFDIYTNSIAETHPVMRDVRAVIQKEPRMIFCLNMRNDKSRGNEMKASPASTIQ